MGTSVLHLVIIDEDNLNPKCSLVGYPEMTLKTCLQFVWLRSPPTHPPRVRFYQQCSTSHIRKPKNNDYIHYPKNKKITCILRHFNSMGFHGLTYVPLSWSTSNSTYTYSHQIGVGIVSSSQQLQIIKTSIFSFKWELRCKRYKRFT